MDFNKTQLGRFNSLASERNNPFSSSRQARNGPSSDGSSSEGSINGLYLPPSTSNAIKRNDDRCENRSTEHIFLSDDRRNKPTPPPDTENRELFPSLTSEVKIYDEQREDVTKPSFVAITTDKEEVPKVPNEKELLKPGWVKLFRGPNLEIMREHGPSVVETPYIKSLKEYEYHLALENLIDTLERNIAYTRELDPYYEHYNCDQDKDNEKYLSDNDYVEECESDYSEDDY